jgi:hypothetical protein
MSVIKIPHHEDLWGFSVVSRIINLGIRWK